MNPKRIIFADRMLLVAYLVAVYYLCFGHISTPESLPFSLCGIPMDKVMHFLMFIPMPFLCTFALEPGTLKGRAIVVIAASLVLTIIMGGLIEIVQGFTTDRSKDVFDFLADCVGALFGAAVTLPVIKLYLRRI